MTTTARIDPTAVQDTWQGWGTSLCWWANVFGERDDVADILFTRERVPYDGQRLPGLGLNIARYNIGGCIPGSGMVVSPNIPPWKQIEGFWRDGGSADPDGPGWDWSADPRQRAMLQKARDRGVDLVEMFSNSPLWWMCRNHNPSGAADGSENLDPALARDHARYLATVVARARDHWGVDVASVDPFNEPSADWWKADGTQEGCHVGHATQARVIGQLRAELDARGLDDVEVAASDESLYDHAIGTWESFPEATRARVGRVNVHGYQYEAGRRDLLSTAVRATGTPLWQSEYGDGDGTGLRLARNLVLDLRLLRPTAWVYWQALDGLDWGLISCDEDDGTLGRVNPKYFVLAHFTRHIRPGMQLLGVSERTSTGDTGGDTETTVAAYDHHAPRLVLVTINVGDAPREQVWDLTGFRAAAGSSLTMRCWLTRVDPGGERYVETSPPARRTPSTLTTAVPPRAVQTLEIDGLEV